MSPTTLTRTDNTGRMAQRQWCEFAGAATRWALGTAVGAFQPYDVRPPIHRGDSHAHRRWVMRRQNISALSLLACQVVVLGLFAVLASACSSNLTRGRAEELIRSSSKKQGESMDFRLSVDGPVFWGGSSVLRGSFGRATVWVRPSSESARSRDRLVVGRSARDVPFDNEAAKQSLVQLLRQSRRAVLLVGSGKRES